jgi:hypothetical protein
MSLEPGMITDGRVPGARSAPGGRIPCLLTCAPLGRDIAPGVDGRSVGATLLAPVGEYRLNSDRDRDSEWGPFALVYGCFEPAPNRHFPPLSATCSTIVWGGVVLCKFNGRHRMGTARGILSAVANASGGHHTNRHDKSMALFTIFFVPFSEHSEGDSRFLFWSVRNISRDPERGMQKRGLARAERRVGRSGGRKRVGRDHADCVPN